MSAAASEAARAEAARWLAYALEDRAIVELALGRTPSLIVGAAFHTRQAAEKLVKAMLILVDRPFPRTHDIGLLLSMLEPIDGLSEDAKQFLEAMTPWGVKMRYPTAGDERLPGTEDIREALGLVDQLATLVRAAVTAP